MERALFVLAALVANAVFFSARGPYGRFGLDHYCDAPARLIRMIERKLNRAQRTLTTLQWRGMLLLVATLMAALGVGCVLNLWRHTPLHYLDIIILACVLPVRPTWDRAYAIHSALSYGDTAGARLVLKDSPWRHYALLDAHALARSAIEILAVNFSEKILSPALWYVLFGMPGLMLCKALVLLEESLCQPLSVETAFGRPSHLLHFAVNYMPARLAAVFWLLSMPFIGVKGIFSAVKQTFNGMGTRMPESQVVLGAGCALKLSLGGPTSIYTGGGWFGVGTAKAAPVDIKRMLYIYILAHVFTVLLLGIACFARLKY